LWAKDILDWVEINWGMMLGYVPETYILLKGWFCFIFKTLEDAEMVLQRFWVVNRGSLMMKRWHLTFNLEKESFRLRHLWVLLLRFHLALWSVEVFKIIENAIGKFIHVYLK